MKENTRIKQNIEQFINDKIILCIRLKIHYYNPFDFQNKTGTLSIQNMNAERVKLRIARQSNAYLKEEENIMVSIMQ